MVTADRIGIKLDDDDLNNSIKGIAQNNNMSISQFRDAIEADGYDFNTFRETIRGDMIISRLHKVQVSDVGLEAVAASCTKLQLLDLSNGNYITNRGLRAIAARCPNLEHLNLSKCPRVAVGEIAHLFPNTMIAN